MSVEKRGSKNLKNPKLGNNIFLDTAFALGKQALTLVKSFSGGFDPVSLFHIAFSMEQQVNTEHHDEFLPTKKKVNTKKVNKVDSSNLKQEKELPKIDPSTQKALAQYMELISKAHGNYKENHWISLICPEGTEISSKYTEKFAQIINQFALYKHDNQADKIFKKEIFKTCNELKQEKSLSPRVIKYMLQQVKVKHGVGTAKRLNQIFDMLGVHKAAQEQTLNLSKELAHSR